MNNFEKALLKLDDILTYPSGKSNLEKVNQACISDNNENDIAECIRDLILHGDSDSGHIYNLQLAFIEYFETDKDTELVESDLNDNVY